MGYLALYRKYRPQNFDQVYGQSTIVQTLRNQVIMNRIGHAYLFSGPRGTGKTSIAQIFSKAINCESPENGSPCGKCNCCKMTQDSLNIDIVEIDAASNNGVDNIRELIEESKYLPQYGKRKVYIIDEVHMLSSSAFNALLKTLEEPTSSVVFILATTELQKIPATIYSRCQQFQFKLLTDDMLTDALQDVCISESVEYEDEALHHIAKLAKGGLRDAYSLMDQYMSFHKKISMQYVYDVFGEIQDTVTKEIASCIDSGDIVKLLDLVKEQEQNGRTLQGICSSLYEHYKDICFKDMSNMTAQRYMRILAELSEKLKRDNSRINFEINMIKMCKPQMETDYSSLVQRIQQLESLVSSLVSGKTVEVQPEPIDNSQFVTIQYKMSPVVTLEYI